jgi:hypothetical protein
MVGKKKWGYRLSYDKYEEEYLRIYLLLLFTYASQILLNGWIMMLLIGREFLYAS